MLIFIKRGQVLVLILFEKLIDFMFSASFFPLSSITVEEKEWRETWAEAVEVCRRKRSNKRLARGNRGAGLEGGSGDVDKDIERSGGRGHR